MESIKEELGEELQHLEKINPFEYDENNLIERVEDDWIKPEDREKLLLYLKDLVSIEHPWADDALTQCIIMKKYYSTIKNMNREQYEEDIKNPVKSILSILS